MKIPAIVKGIAVLIVVIALGVTIGLMSSSKNPTNEDETAPKSSTSLPDNSQSATAANIKVRPVTPVATSNAVPVAPAPQVNPAVNVTPVAANVITNWEEKLDEIFTSDSAEAEKAREMAALLPRLPEDGQVEVANHLSNLVLDEDYSLISKFLTDTSLPEAVLDVFMADSLNRANSIKLPALLEVAQNAQHPKAGEAKEILELFLEEDYGTDWNQWKTKVQEWIAANPD